jgi:hypothetical protein
MGIDSFPDFLNGNRSVEGVLCKKEIALLLYSETKAKKNRHYRKEREGVL